MPVSKNHHAVSQPHTTQPGTSTWLQLSAQYTCSSSKREVATHGMRHNLGKWLASTITGGTQLDKVHHICRFWGWAKRCVNAFRQDPALQVPPNSTVKLAQKLFALTVSHMPQHCTWLRRAHKTKHEAHAPAQMSVAATAAPNSCTEFISQGAYPLP